MTRRQLLGRLMATGAMAALVACTRQAPQVAGAPEAVPTPRPADRRPSEGGIGGTGIVGVLTGLGSLLINGLRVETAEGVVVEGPDGALPLSAIAPGHSLTVEAGGPAGALTARRVLLTPPLMGPLNAGAGGLSVNGVPVVLPAGVSGQSANGGHVMVSGLWDGTRVVASRLDPAPAGAALIAGTAGRTPGGRLTVGGREIGLLDPSRPLPIAGTYVTVRGADTGSLFLASALAQGRFSPGFDDLVALSVEGYLEPQRAAPGFAISGLGHSLDGAAQVAPLAGQRALIEGPYDGLFTATRALVLPEDPSGRRALLDERLAGAATADIPLR
ncbi:MAG: hypothetical protein AAFQ88_07025 [Pseudomonadota bacterium]